MKVKTFKIEIVDLFKRNTQNGPEFYVSYNNKKYIMKSQDWENAKKEAEEILHKINPNIIVD